MTIFLDLDGPVLDTAERNFQVYRTIVQELGYSTKLDVGSFWKIKRAGVSSVDIFSHERPSAEFDPAQFSQHFYAKIEESSWLMLDRIQPGVEKWLHEMNEKSSLVLVTLRQYRDRLDEQLARLNLRKHFQAILSDSPKAGKGWHTKCRLIARSNFPIQGAIIGDTEVDIRAGKLLGLGTIALSNGIRDGNFLVAEEPDLLLDSLPRVSADSIESLVRKARTP